MNQFTKTDEGFQEDAEKYAGYLETAEGRLRLNLTVATVEEFLPALSASRPLRALDLGGGTGAAAVGLARRGVEVSLLDSSLAMLNLAERAAQKAGIADKVVLHHGDIAQVGQLYAGQVFDIVLCHNVLEHVERPGDVIGDCARFLRRDSPGLLSILVRNRAGEILKAAIRSGDLEAAEQSLSADWAYESLYGGRVRLFNRDELLAMSKEAGLELIAERGVRVVADYLPQKVDRQAEYQRIFELERKLGRRPEFAAIARYTHHILRHPAGVKDDPV